MSLFALFTFETVVFFEDRGSRYLSILKGEIHLRRAVTPAKKGLLGPRLLLRSGFKSAYFIRSLLHTHHAL